MTAAVIASSERERKNFCFFVYVRVQNPRLYIHTAYSSLIYAIHSKVLVALCPSHAPTLTPLQHSTVQGDPISHSAPQHWLIHISAGKYPFRSRSARRVTLSSQSREPKCESRHLSVAQMQTHPNNAAAHLTISDAYPISP